MDDIKIAETFVPESVKNLITNFQMHKLAEQLTGIEDFSSFEKIANYFGGRMAARRLKWRPVFEGLNALRTLR